jgi:hypothetical protein
MHPEAPAGAIGVVYGDFFLQVGEKDVEFVRNSPYWDNFPLSIFQFLFLFLLFQLFIGITEVRGR